MENVEKNIYINIFECRKKDYDYYGKTIDTQIIKW